MTKKLVLAAVLALLAVPVAAAEERPPAPGDHPERAAKAPKHGEEAAGKKLRKFELKQAKRQCRALKKELGPESFAATYPTIWACVLARVEAERANRSEAKADCLAKLDKPARLGKRAKAKRLAACTTKTAAEDSALEREAVVNGAKACAEELAADPAGFRAEWGKSRNLANAFGKCVASKAKAAGEDEKDVDDEGDEIVEDEGEDE